MAISIEGIDLSNLIEAHRASEGLSLLDNAQTTEMASVVDPTLQAEEVLTLSNEGLAFPNELSPVEEVRNTRKTFTGIKLGEIALSASDKIKDSLVHGRRRLYRRLVVGALATTSIFGISSVADASPMAPATSTAHPGGTVPPKEQAPASASAAAKDVQNGTIYEDKANTNTVGNAIFQPLFKKVNGKDAPASTGTARNTLRYDISHDTRDLAVVAGIQELRSSNKKSGEDLLSDIDNLAGVYSNKANEGKTAKAEASAYNFVAWLTSTNSFPGIKGSGVYINAMRDKNSATAAIVGLVSHSIRSTKLLSGFEFGYNADNPSLRSSKAAVDAELEGDILINDDGTVTDQQATSITTVSFDKSTQPKPTDIQPNPDKSAPADPVTQPDLDATDGGPTDIGDQSDGQGDGYNGSTTGGNSPEGTQCEDDEPCTPGAPPPAAPPATPPSTPPATPPSTPPATPPATPPSTPPSTPPTSAPPPTTTTIPSTEKDGDGTPGDTGGTDPGTGTTGDPF